MSDQEKLLLLRVQLYGAVQLLKGEELRGFWALIDEIQSLRPLHQSPQAPEPKP